VIPLEPAFVTPQDGHEKQDCENAAAKRWLSEYGERYAALGVTILGDDLYCKQPLCGNRSAPHHLSASAVAYPLAGDGNW
jgi:hypothetical protein